MTEYIERDMLCRVLERYRKAPKNRYQRGVEDGMELALNAIKAIHTADVAPVAHGRWEWFDEETGTPFTGYEREWGWKCSYCGEELPDDYDDPDNRPTFRFCHSCGAKMDGGVDDAAD